ncbi:type II toxin-antitoxin system HicA family toxin [Microbulbifer harenosus]|uniref:Type II toxin-antitoxin system HicA family toxin n=1 Tax=Microbulbifer harenosus TaxID=2576840 RepID=A0ABY2UMZ0_9GAMM|nr:type II toxin-antitoxin system HicA family toxin [Microbulbifer harenosus]TLM79934.1 type II toxin-antitoxin system HicA family toxin [Microbulbifer harenosus]
MSKKDKLEDLFWGDPVPTDFTWDNLCTLLQGVYGYEIQQGSGSRVRFYMPDNSWPQLRFHTPHPGSIVKKVYIKQARDTLRPYVGRS